MLPFTETCAVKDSDHPLGNTGVLGGHPTHPQPGTEGKKHQSLQALAGRKHWNMTCTPSPEMHTVYNIKKSRREVPGCLEILYAAHSVASLSKREDTLNLDKTQSDWLFRSWMGLSCVLGLIFVENESSECGGSHIPGSACSDDR
jgi:hypothetical protein